MSNITQGPTHPGSVVIGDGAAITLDCGNGLEFAEGQAYGVVPAIISGENYRILNAGSSARYYNPFIYWWPNRSNGAPYNENQL